MPWFNLFKNQIANFSKNSDFWTFNINVSFDLNSSLNLGMNTGKAFSDFGLLPIDLLILVFKKYHLFFGYGVETRKCCKE